jgi:hypothetical protein
MRGNNLVAIKRCSVKERQERVWCFVGVVDFRIFFKSCRKKTGGGKAILLDFAEIGVFWKI